MTDATYDLVSLGRANMDLFSQDIGADFENVTGFDAMVGGSPTNIAIGLSRLGMRAVALTGVGDDRVGDFVLRYLRDEGVETRYVYRKPGKLTSLALLGVQPPSTFPLSFYREDPADIYLNAEDVTAAPIGRARSLQVSGNALSRGPCAEAARHAIALANEWDVAVYVDLDLRPTEWPDLESYGAAIREVAPQVDVVIGTEEEFAAALSAEGEPTGSLDPATVDDMVARWAADSTGHLVVKRGEHGASLFSRDGRVDVPGFPARVVNTVGAGDAFAAGLIRSRLLGWDWARATRFANGCGAFVVTKHGCASALPTEKEVIEFTGEL